MINGGGLIQTASNMYNMYVKKVFFCFCVFWDGVEDGGGDG